MGSRSANSARAEGGAVMAEKKKVPLGAPLSLTNAELTDAAVVTEEDIEQAKKFWRENAPEKFWNLLDAETTEEGE